MKNIRIGGVPEHFNLPWHLALEEGLFLKAGVSVEWIDFPEGTGAMNKALRAKEIDYSPPTIEEKDDSIKDFEENYFRKAYKNLTTPVSRAEKKINGSPESLASQSCKIN